LFGKSSFFHEVQTISVASKIWRSAVVLQVFPIGGIGEKINRLRSGRQGMIPCTSFYKTIEQMGLKGARPFLLAA
jgi:hypothetical protein